MRRQRAKVGDRRFYPQQQPSGLLRVSLPVDFANTSLAPLIAEFAQQHPGITFEFDLTPRRVDLVSEPFDLAIRVGESEPSQMIARPLALPSADLYASPRYLEINGEPKQPSDLTRHQCLCMMKAKNWTLHKVTQTTEVDISGRFRLNSVGMIRRLATLNMGIAFMPEEIVADEIANARLRRILPQRQGPPGTVYAITETRLLPAKTQRFIEFFAGAAKPGLITAASRPAASRKLNNNGICFSPKRKWRNLIRSPRRRARAKPVAG